MSWGAGSFMRNIVNDQGKQIEAQNIRIDNQQKQIESLKDTVDKILSEVFINNVQYDSRDKHTLTDNPSPEDINYRLNYLGYGSYPEDDPELDKLAKILPDVMHTGDNKQKTCSSPLIVPWTALESEDSSDESD